MKEVDASKCLSCGKIYVQEQPPKCECGNDQFVQGLVGVSDKDEDWKDGV